MTTLQNENKNLDELCKELTEEEKRKLQSEVKRLYPYFAVKTNNEIVDIYLQVGRDLGFFGIDEF